MKKITQIGLFIGIGLFVLFTSIPIVISLIHYIGGFWDFGMIFLLALFFFLGLGSIVLIPYTIWFIKTGKQRSNFTLFEFFYGSIVIVILAGSFLLPIPMYIWNENIEVRNSGEIVILRDSDFVYKYLFPGSGTKEDPYIISDLMIDTTKDNGILIKETTAFFEIRNCSIKADRNAIYINHAAENTALITNNNFLSLILIENTIESVIIDNIGNSDIVLFNSHKTLIKQNICNSIILDVKWYSGITNTNNQITGNVCFKQDDSSYSYGISIENSINTIISYNHIFNHYTGLDSKHSNNLLLYNNQIHDNTGGLYTYFTDNITMINNNIYSNVQYGAYLEHSNLCTISHNNLTNNRHGLDYSGYYSNITNNIFKNNTEIGCVIDGYALNFEYNEINYNGEGLQINAVDHTNITYNTFTNNTLYGIINSYDSNHLYFYYNNFYYNNYQAFLADNSSQVYYEVHYHVEYPVFWYNPTTSEGNYWNELVWNEGVVYAIDGGDYTDLYPLANPVTI
ncbi:MAG: hypothetical protein FK734_05380 [Asgard group archaeon]|nr:hypothetical protein [Asgard group archaeon]